jgi:NADH:ubiquinone reductase (H+-translocating)
MATRPHVVVIGAGFGGLAAAKRLEREAVDVTLIDRHNYHTFQPLLYQVATAGLNPADVGYAVRGLFRRQQRVVFRKGQVTGVDWDGHQVRLRDEPPIGFDHLIIAAGSATNYFGVPGAAEYAFPLYGLDDAVRVRNHLLGLYEAAEADPGLIDEGVLNLVIVGGGPTGVEVAGAMAELVTKVLEQDFHDLDAHRTRVVLVEQAPHLLAPFRPGSRRYAHRVLEDRGVEVRLDTAVTAVGPDSLTFADGTRLHTRLVVWAAGVRASTLADGLGATQGRGGRITVADDLSIPGFPNAFAVGDVADIDDGHGGRLPQLAQVAIQGGEHAADQVLATIARRPHQPFRYHDKGTMATIGRRAAVAELPRGVRLTGSVAWLAWLVLHLVYLLGVRNRVSVFLNWAWNYLTWDRGPRLILRPEVLPHTPHPLSDGVPSGRGEPPTPAADPPGDSGG